MGIRHNVIMGPVGFGRLYGRFIGRRSIAGSFLVLTSTIQMYAAQTAKQGLRIKRTAHSRQNLSICVPFTQHAGDFFCFLCVDSVCFVQNQHGGAADLLLHQPVGCPLL
ncbi:hypothetical protein D3C80_1786860 [compost metagenome]